MGTGQYQRRPPERRHCLPHWLDCAAYAVTLACSASPASIFPGDPVTVTATASNLDPKLNAVYSFSGTGVTGNGATAAVATATLAPGSYTVKCGIKEGKPGKEGSSLGNRRRHGQLYGEGV